VESWQCLFVSEELRDRFFSSKGGKRLIPTSTGEVYVAHLPIGRLDEGRRYMLVSRQGLPQGTEIIEIPGFGVVRGWTEDLRNGDRYAWALDVFYCLGGGGSRRASVARGSNRWWFSDAVDLGLIGEDRVVLLSEIQHKRDIACYQLDRCGPGLTAIDSFVLPPLGEFRLLSNAGRAEVVALGLDDTTVLVADLATNRCHQLDLQQTFHGALVEVRCAGGERRARLHLVDALHGEVCAVELALD